MPKFSLTATVSLQLGNEARPSTSAIAIEVTYSEKSMLDYVWTTAQTNLPIPQGSVTNPRVVIVEVLEGEVRLSTDPTGEGPIKLNANPTPETGTPPATFIMFTHDAQAAQYYVTTTGAARARFTFLE